MGFFHVSFNESSVLKSRLHCQIQSSIGSCPSQCLTLRRPGWSENACTPTCMSAQSKQQPPESVHRWSCRQSERSSVLSLQIAQSLGSHVNCRMPFSNHQHPVVVRSRRGGRAMKVTTVVSMTVSVELPKHDYFVHTVRWGETLHSIAKKYDVPVEEIVEFNEIEDLNCILDKTRLRIPGSPGIMGPIRRLAQVSESSPVENYMLRRKVAEKKKARKKRESIKLQAVEQAPRPTATQLGLQVVAAVAVLSGALSLGVGLSFAWAWLCSFARGDRARSASARGGRPKRFGRAQMLDRMNGALVNDRVSLLMSVQPPLPEAVPETAVPQERVLATVAIEGEFPDIAGPDLGVAIDDDEFDDLRRVDRSYEETLRAYDQMQSEYQKFLRDARVGRQSLLERNRKSPTQR